GRMTITVGCPQTNRKTDTGKTLKPWPVLVDHYILKKVSHLMNSDCRVMSGEVKAIAECSSVLDEPKIIKKLNCLEGG
ncbi:MAG: hypothetical protein E7D20_04380, partial [Citrobacter freundii]|nr:hypothetical protein [Citrobacter freundii]